MEPSLNASQYPRTYRLSIGWMAFMLLFGLGAVWLGAYTTWQLVFRSHDPQAAMIPAAIFVLIALFGLWLIRAVPRYRMVLYADRIEVHQLLRPRTLLRDDIQGRRVEEGENSANNVVLVPRGGGREMTIESSFRVDEFFWQWIQALPDLDAQELQASREEILDSPEGSPARADRADALFRAKSFARVMTGVTVASAFWAWFFPQLYSLTLLALLPWLAVFIVARSEGLFRMVAEKNDAHADMTIPFVLPGFVLMARSFDFHLLELEPILIFSAGAGIALWMAAAAADSFLRKNRAGFIFILLLAVVYGYGASREANAVLDQSPETVYRPPVVGKYTYSGKHTTYHLELGAWGPDLRIGEESVPSSFYNSVRTGDRVCVIVREGALRVPWYRVSQCD